MSKRMLAVFFGLTLLAGAAAEAFAAGVPAPVSPGGGNADGTGASTPCPTFSWGAVDGANAYELAVFELVGEDLSFDDSLAIAGDPVLRKTIPAPALSWTPGAGQCLRPDMSYTWYIRGVDREGPGPWSAGQMFGVLSRFSDEEFDAAVAAAIERYILEKKAFVPPSAAGPSTYPGVSWEDVPDRKSVV